MGTPRTCVCLAESAEKFVRAPGAAAASEVPLQEVAGATKIRI